MQSKKRLNFSSFSILSRLILEAGSMRDQVALELAGGGELAVYVKLPAPLFCTPPSILAIRDKKGRRQISIETFPPMATLHIFPPQPSPLTCPLPILQL